MPRITYNSINIDINVGDKSLQPMAGQVFSQNQAGSGKLETINLYGIESFQFDAYFDIDGWRELYGWWWGWARLGKAWSFAMDSSKTVNTTLDDAAAAAQKVIPLASTADLAVGDYCVIIGDNDGEREMIKIASISAGVSITAEDNLVFSYASGDAFRHNEYYPSVINTKKKFDYSQSGDTFKYTFEFTEAP